MGEPEDDGIPGRDGIDLSAHFAAKGITSWVECDAEGTPVNVAIDDDGNTTRTESKAG